VRLFVAVDVGAELRSRLTEATRRLRAEAPDAKWIGADGVHVTLVFLGEVEDAVASEIAGAVGAVARRHAPLTLGARGSGSFGPGRRPRVLWIGLDGGLAELAAIQEDLVAALTPLGHEPERRAFQPHLTLARARHPRGDPALARCVTALADVDLGSIEVSELVLYQSDLSSNGARHTPLSRARLGDGAP